MIARFRALRYRLFMRRWDRHCRRVNRTAIRHAVKRGM